MPVGYFGGTFDPIHNGHLDVARAAADAAGLDRLYLVPASVPPHRTAPRASAAHRFAMVALALEGEARLQVSDLEMASKGPSYTSATLDRIEASGVETRQIYLVTGADAFRDIPSWKDYPALLDRCHMVVVSRPGLRAPDLRALLPALASRMHDAAPGGVTFLPATPGILLVDAPTAPVSSTEVRRRIAAHESLAGCVPRVVEEYIAQHALYAEQA
jgi:nicotinate-nucleotide adenylyltransferase